MILIDTQREEFSKLKDIRVFGKVSNEERFNKDLLYIGLGGVGSKVVTNLKVMLQEHITPEDNINFLMIDSDIPAMEQAIEDSKEGYGLNALEIISIYRPNLESLITDGIANNPVHPNLANWMKPEFPGLSIGTDGAKGNRQIGRLMFSNAYEDMRILLFEKLDELYNKSESGKLDVIIITGVAGGTGSGILSDVTYNIKAFGRSRKWKGLRVGGCLLMPDVLFANLSISEDEDKKSLLLANGCATLKEVDYLMRIVSREENFSFESTTHRLSMRENIFDACLLVSGKKDEQGYIPENVIYSDTAYFLFKLACNKYIGGNVDEDRKLLRDVFFENNGNGLYKVINESDYKIPIKEIENICEHAIFSEAYKRIHDVSNLGGVIERDAELALGDIRDFLTGKPGEEIKLNITGLIRTGQFERPVYKMIKKGQDNLRLSMARQLESFKQDIPIVIKSFKNKLCASLDSKVEEYLRQYGPFITLELIGAAGIGEFEHDRGFIAELRKLEELQREYQPTSEYSRIIESIKDMVAKKFFAFPSAKKETENGYYDACIKETLATERNLIVDGLDSLDVFGDAVRLLKQKAERIYDIYSQFDEDLRIAVEDLAVSGRKVTSYLMKGATQSEFLPSDYINEARISEMRDGIIKLMIDNEANIDNGRVVSVKPALEDLYKRTLLGIGVYGPEKLIYVAFADKKPTLQDTNVMFVSATNERRDEVMARAAKSFVEGSEEKTSKKTLCVMKEGFKDIVANVKYVSLPYGMPYFSEAIKDVFMAAPYSMSQDKITLNAGELEISIDDMYTNVPLSLLECVDDMQKAYNSVDSNVYFGLHTDEVNKDMREYPNIA
ncbi:MAG: hypothetical protein E7258_05730 [Lachnospiraceae bacterium]|nr:hypothetical protein [Lachnospiraceae bacterium]